MLSFLVHHKKRGRNAKGGATSRTYSPRAAWGRLTTLPDIRSCFWDFARASCRYNCGTGIATLSSDVLHNQGVYFHSCETHVVLYLVLVSIVIKVAEDSFLTLHDLAGPGELVAARMLVDGLLESYSSRPEVLQAGVTEGWIGSFFFKLPAAPIATAEPASDGDLSGDESK